MVATDFRTEFPLSLTYPPSKQSDRLVECGRWSSLQDLQPSDRSRGVPREPWRAAMLGL